MIEINIGIENLWSLYRSERSVGFGYGQETIEANIELSLVIDNRIGDTPDKRTLIKIAPQFLKRAITDISNRIAADFDIEYGGGLVGFIKEQDLHNNSIVLLHNKTTKENHSLSYFFTSFVSQRLYNNITLTYNESTEQNYLDYNRSRKRIISLIDADFAPEAISVANALFEVLCREILLSIIRDHQLEQSWLMLNKKFGYDRCRNIITKSSEHAIDSNLKKDVIILMLNLEIIYKKRNSYVHSLSVTDHDFTRSVDLTREALTLLSPLIDAHESIMTIRLIQSIIHTGQQNWGQVAIQHALNEVRLGMNSVNEELNGLQSESASQASL